MKNLQAPKCIVETKAIQSLTGTLFIVIAVIIGTLGIAEAKSSDLDNFITNYGNIAIANCSVCHPGYNTKQFNNYAIDYISNGRNINAFALIESHDSDQDTFTNIEEINAETYPGDASSFPDVAANVPPVAYAGPDQDVNEGATVTLDGSGSSDSDGVIVGYSWVQTGGPAVTLSNASAVKPTFTAPNITASSVTLTFELTVIDDGGATSTDFCYVNVFQLNEPPVANAGPDQTVDIGVTVTLDGSNSADPNNNIVTYSWVQTAGPTVTPSDPAAVKPTFNSADVGLNGGSLTFELTVTDALGLSDVDACIVNVTAGNLPPAADAGLDQTVDEGITVTLNGSGSSDPDGVINTFQWSQTAGPAVTLSDAAAARPTFTAPDVGPGGDSLTFNLTVIDDGGLQSSDTCIVNISWINFAPVADAGGDQTGSSGVEEGSTVMLDGSGSSDPDDGIASYLWEQTGAGPAVTLSDPAAANPTFVTPTINTGDVTLTFRLTVADTGGLQATDQVLVSVYDNGIAGFPAEAITTMSSEGVPIGVTEGSGGSITELAAMDPTTLPDPSGMPEDLMYGLLDLKVKTDVPGGTATVVIHLANPVPDGYKWYKYNEVTRKWIDYTTTDVNDTKGAVFNAARDQVTLTLVDNGPGDDDGVQNGIIADPSGVGASSSSIPAAGSNDFGGSSSGCFITTAGVGSQGLPLELKILMGSMLVLLGCVAAEVCLKIRRQKCELNL
jgi:hypothetical protein